MLHAQRSAEVTVTVRDALQAIFTCPEPVPARAAISQFDIVMQLAGSDSCHLTLLPSVQGILCGCWDNCNDSPISTVHMTEN
eukprot:1703284-Pleurochrysis_carterae.AAC.1